MGPGQVSGLLARDSSHRNCPANFAAGDVRQQAAGQRQDRRHPKKHCCNEPIHASLSPSLMTASIVTASITRQVMGIPPPYERMRFHKGKISAKKRWRASIDRKYEECVVNAAHSGASGSGQQTPPSSRETGDSEGSD